MATDRMGEGRRETKHSRRRRGWKRGRNHNRRRRGGRRKRREYARKTLRVRGEAQN